MDNIRSCEAIPGPRLLRGTEVDMNFSITVAPICLLLIKGFLVQGGIQQSPALLEVPAGASVELGCFFDAPAVVPTMAAFQWDLPNGKLYQVLPAGRVGGNTDRRVNLQAELKSRSSRLSISRVSSEDGGLYVCVVQLLEPLPIVQMKGIATHLHIIPGSTPVPGGVSQSPVSVSVREGEPVTLTCLLQTTATEVEEMSFIWMWATSLTTCSTVPGFPSRWQCAPVPDTGVLITADLQTKSSEFSITRASLNHTGTYKCDVAITKSLAKVILHGNGSTLLVEGEVESPGTNKSDDLRLLPVNTDWKTPKRWMEPWFFTLLLCTVVLSLTAGLLFSYCTARRTRATDAGSGKEHHGKPATGRDTSPESAL